MANFADWVACGDLIPKIASSAHLQGFEKTLKESELSKLTKDEIVTLQVLHTKKESNRSIARRLHVTEGTVRYHPRRLAAAASDGRKKQTQLEKLGLVEVCKSQSKTEAPGGRKVRR